MSRSTVFVRENEIHQEVGSLDFVAFGTKELMLLRHKIGNGNACRVVVLKKYECFVGVSVRMHEKCCGSRFRKMSGDLDY
jgi:hypothetical protein